MWTVNHFYDVQIKIGRLGLADQSVAHLGIILLEERSWRQQEEKVGGKYQIQFKFWTMGNILETNRYNQYV